MGNGESIMTQEQLIALPKIELHCHLDGSLSREFVQKQYGIRDEEVLLLMRNAVDAVFAGEAVKERLYRSLYNKI